MGIGYMPQAYATARARPTLGRPEGLGLGPTDRQHEEPGTELHPQQYAVARVAIVNLEPLLHCFGEREEYLHFFLPFSISTLRLNST